MLLRREKLLLRAAITSRTEEEWHERWKEKREEELKPHGGPSDLDEPLKWAEIFFLAENPPTHPFNDLFGFVDLFWDSGIRFLGDFYYIGDARRRPGNSMKQVHGVGMKTRGFYEYSHRVRLVRFPGANDNASLRSALYEAMDKIEVRVAEQRGHIDLSWWREIYAHTDLLSLLQPEGDR